jgi:hypothetical protein
MSKLDWELQAYGCTADQLDKMVEEQCFKGQELLFAAGILSDAQEILSAEFNEGGWVSPDQANEVRQFLNRAKHIMFKLKEKEQA